MKKFFKRSNFRLPFYKEFYEGFCFKMKMCFKGVILFLNRFLKFENIYLTFVKCNESEIRQLLFCLLLSVFIIKLKSLPHNLSMQHISFLPKWTISLISYPIKIFQKWIAWSLIFIVSTGVGFYITLDRESRILIISLFIIISIFCFYVDE